MNICIVGMWDQGGINRVEPDLVSTYPGPNRELSALLTWAWRSLYAETTKARIENQRFNKTSALYMLTRYLYSRVTAYGHKWKRWFNRQRLWQPGATKKVGSEHQDYILIQVDEDANYNLSPELKTLYEELVSTPNRIQNQARRQAR